MAPGVTEVAPGVTDVVAGVTDVVFKHDGRSGYRVPIQDSRLIASLIE